MRSVEINGCSVDMVPVVRGLVSDRAVIRPLFDNDYDVAGVSLGPEDLEAVSRRDEITEKPELGDLDAVYAHLLMRFGDVELPTPAYSELVDVCKERSVEIVPLDMDDATYTELFCDKVRVRDLLRETKVAKKAMRHRFTDTLSDRFAMEWDDFINRRMKGMSKISLEREVFMANAIANHAEGKKRMLAVVEVERMAGILDLLR